MPPLHRSRAHATPHLRVVCQRRLRLGEGGTLIKEDGRWVVDLTRYKRNPGSSPHSRRAKRAERCALCALQVQAQDVKGERRASTSPFVRQVVSFCVYARLQFYGPAKTSMSPLVSKWVDAYIASIELDFADEDIGDDADGGDRAIVREDVLRNG